MAKNKEKAGAGRTIVIYLWFCCCFLQQELMDMACTTFPVIFFQALW